MKKHIIALVCLLIICFSGIHTFGQTTKKYDYDLPARVRHHLLEPAKPAFTMVVLDSATIPAIRCLGVFWLTGVSFSEGTIELDVRGNNTFLQSFLGIAFHGIDSASYEVVYFRPFNFHHTDTTRHNWGVQYMSLPDFPYDKLRTEHPLVYEHAVNPVPGPGDWFHTRIVVDKDNITVYVDHADEYSLKVQSLSARHDGKIGVWADGLPEDFANLVITTDSSNK